jgi:hypothetical protein
MFTLTLQGPAARRILITVMGLSSVLPIVMWLPFLAACLHIFEEFVWPGGFAAWYRQFDPPAAAGITTRFLVIMNGILLALCLGVPLGGARQGVQFWLTASAVCAGNALWHCYAAWKTRRYAPGVVTGVILYLPLAAYGFRTFTRNGLAGPFMVGQALLIGAGYVYWSIRRRQRSRGSSS